LDAREDRFQIRWQKRGRQGVGRGLHGKRKPQKTNLAFRHSIIKYRGKFIWKKAERGKHPGLSAERFDLKELPEANKQRWRAKRQRPCWGRVKRKRQGERQSHIASQLEPQKSRTECGHAPKQQAWVDRLRRTGGKAKGEEDRRKLFGRNSRRSAMPRMAEQSRPPPEVGRKDGKKFREILGQEVLVEGCPSLKT